MVRQTKRDTARSQSVKEKHMAKERKPKKSEPKARTLSLSIKVTPEVRDAIEYIAARYPGDDGEPCDEGTAVEICILGYHGRKLALDTHAEKKRKVAAALKAGKSLPKVEFKRYLPAYKHKALDAKGTEREVAAWTHKAPERAVPVAVERKPKAPVVRKKADKGNERVAASV